MRNATAAVAAVLLICGSASAGLAMPKMAHHAAFQLNSTSWTYREKGQPRQESIGPKGDYVVHSGAKHIDHGTVVMKDGKVCFTSAMTKDGEDCYTAKPTAIGSTMKTVSDTGEKYIIKRVAYTPPKM